jgi:hypothetical protein
VDIRNEPSSFCVIKSLYLHTINNNIFKTGVFLLQIPDALRKNKTNVPRDSEPPPPPRNLRNAGLGADSVMTAHKRKHRHRPTLKLLHIKMAFILLKMENIFQLALSRRLVAPLIAPTSLNFRQPEHVQVAHYFYMKKQ